MSAITYSVTILGAGETFVISAEGGADPIAEIKLDAVTNPVTLLFDDYVFPDEKKIIATKAGGTTGEVLFATTYYLSNSPAAK